MRRCICAIALLACSGPRAEPARAVATGIAGSESIEARPPESSEANDAAELQSSSLTAIEEASLTSSDCARAGFVALSSDGARVLIGAPRERSTGRAHVHVRDGADWTEEAQLTATGGEPGDYFGGSVALTADGSRALVGAEGEGTARVFVRSGAAWTEEATLLRRTRTTIAGAARAVAISADGTRALVGAAGGVPPVSGAAGGGVVQVFVRTEGAWTQEAVLFASDPEPNDRFGASLAVSSDGTRAVIGVPSDAGGGSARVFVRSSSGSRWTEEATLLASNAEGSSAGSSVAITADGDLVLVGAPRDRSGGSARVFRRTGTSWTEEARLVAADTQPGDLFGVSVGLSSDGSTALAGGGPGSARVFVRAGTTWTPGPTLPPVGSPGSSLGLASDGSRAILGACVFTIGEPHRSRDARAERRASRL